MAGKAEKTLEDLFHDMLKDIYFAEQQILNEKDERRDEERAEYIGVLERAAGIRRTHHYSSAVKADY